LPGAGEGCTRSLRRHAELGGGQRGGDVGMRPGVDLWVDAQGDRRAAAQGPGDPVELLELLLALAIELEDPGAQRRAHLVLALADPREDDAARVGARPQRPLQLAAGDDVAAEAVL